MKWDELNYIQKGSLAKIYLKEGISSIDDMKSHYDSLPDDPPPLSMKGRHSKRQQCRTMM